MNPREEKRPRLSFPTMNPPPALTIPFTFPLVHSTVLPDPSRFFTPNLLSSPLPTNSFFQNFALNNAEQPEYIHPYLIKSSNSSLSVSYPSRFFTSAFICQVFVADLTISAVNNGKDCEVKKDHKISSFNDLSVTLDVPPGLRFLLVRGSPYITCEVCSSTQISISTIHAILSISSNSFGTKHKIHFNNNQTWIMYSSSPLNLDSSLSSITFSGFSGALRFAILPDSDPSYESVLDQYSSCYPVSGEAVLGNPFLWNISGRRKDWGSSFTCPSSSCSAFV
ncbi:hypothetical protein IFM89_030696 [Coptis chinensis]|uniref:Glycosyl hydrolase family 81 N-terminal domain-containing protein n=1 Tax=Coptis chinensis TaxID=261450 RepID=A0A835IYZ7_9MAGN|nr:hypothetical protein IFM89_030696 [Coptis chinensis]